MKTVVDTYLEFEKPLAELETRIGELRLMDTGYYEYDALRLRTCGLGAGSCHYQQLVCWTRAIKIRRILCERELTLHQIVVGARHSIAPLRPIPGQQAVVE